MCLKNAIRNNFCRVWFVIMQFVCQDRSWHTKPNVATAPDYFGGSFHTVCKSGSFETCDNVASARQGAHTSSIVRRAGTMRMYKCFKLLTCNVFFCYVRIDPGKTKSKWGVSNENYLSMQRDYGTTIDTNYFAVRVPIL